MISGDGGLSRFFKRAIDAVAESLMRNAPSKAPPTPPTARRESVSHHAQLQETLDSGYLLSPGDTLGGYRIVQRVGQGGFGEVYEAKRMTAPPQRVALKIMYRDTRPDLLARFENEQRALAVMTHPGIPQFHDSGTSESGLPYFTMEFVAGLAVNQYCDRHKLDIRSRLQLFIEICRGVAHIDGKNYIHRDINSNNVMITEGDKHEPLPKIVDFGLAKDLGRPQQFGQETLLASFFGTPEYMSPEQTSVGQLGLDRRTDVYSLGAVLYELLCGSPPFASTIRRLPMPEMARIIQTEEPPRPSGRLAALAAPAPEVADRVAENRQTRPGSLVKQLQSELDWIAMKCLEKSPGRRYASASALAEDIQRYLAGERVQAVQKGWLYATTKFARRHGGRLAAAAVAAALVTLLATTAFSILKERHRQSRAMTLEARRMSFEYPIQALRSLDQALKLDRGNDGVRLQRARIFRRLQDATRSMAEAQKIPRNAPEYGAAAALLSALLAEEDPVLSRSYQEDARRLLKGADSHYERGLNEKDHAVAIGHFDDCIDIKPFHLECNWQRGVLYYLTQQYPAALAAAELATKELPQFDLAWNLKGASRLQLAKQNKDDKLKYKGLDEAREAFDWGVDGIAGDNWILLFNRALALGLLKEHRLALKDLKAAVTLEPKIEREERRVLYEIANNHHDLGEYDQAVVAYERLAAFGISGWRDHYDHAGVLANLNDYQGVVEQCTAALDHVSGDDMTDDERIDLLLFRADSFGYLERFEEAEADIAAAAALAPDSTRLSFHTGYLRMLQRRLPEAITLLDEAERAGTYNLEQTVLARAFAHRMAGDREHSLRDLDNYLSLSDESWVQLWGWAWASENGDAVAAGRHLKAASRLEDNAANPETFRFIRDACMGTGTPVFDAIPAGTVEARLYAYHVLGARAQALGDAAEASQWFGRCVELGEVGYLEHEICEYQLERLSSGDRVEARAGLTARPKTN